MARFQAEVERLTHPGYEWVSVELRPAMLATAEENDRLRSRLAKIEELAREYGATMDRGAPTMEIVLARSALLNFILRPTGDTP